ncbi:MAG: DUF4215 domain-containing protein [Deltaproteobacteria bacterium]|nr:DUF4215 domain-containing protein [Deltaproteobacteria bacterium]
MRTWGLILACALLGCGQPALLTCPLDEVPCADGCVDPLTSNENCGMCGHACDAGTTCTLGQCVPDQQGVCATNNGGCSPDAMCVDMNGTAVCACKPGFTGDGLTCGACAVCDAASFATAPCTPTMDTVCAACAAACTAEDYEAQPCGPFTDRVCAACSVCGIDTFEAQPCGPFSDRVCLTCATCAPNQFVLTPCGPTNDTGCAPCDVGCATCDGPGALCTSCEPGFTLIDGTCQSSCGNGIIEPGELCDDGNLAGGDGCAPTCMVESGAYCFGSPSFCRAGSCAVDALTSLPQGAFALDGGGTASVAGVHLTQRSTIHTTFDVAYPIMVEADVTYSAPDISYLGARGTGLRDIGAADEPDNSLRARLSATAIEFAAGDVVIDSLPTPFTPSFGVTYHVRLVDDGSTASVEWFDPAIPTSGVLFTTGSFFHGNGDKAFVGGGDMGGATFANLRVCSAPTLPVTAGLVARYSGIPSWTSSPDPMGNVSTWRDQSGLGHDLDVNGPNPAYVQGLVNGHGALDFNGGAGLVSQPFALTTDVTVFAVIVNHVPQPWGAIAHHGDRDLDWSLEQSFDSGSTDTLHWQTNNDNANVDLTLVQEQPYVLTGRIAGLERYFSATTLDGAPPSEVAFTDASASITSGTKAMYVGASSLGETSNATIADLVYFDRALSDGERDQVIDYLRRLWRP